MFQLTRYRAIKGYVAGTSPSVVTRPPNLIFILLVSFTPFVLILLYKILESAQNLERSYANDI